MTSTLVKGRRRISKPEPRELPTKERDDGPWRQYKCQRDWKLLIPGYGGVLADSELDFVIKHLEANVSLLAWWGLPARWKRVPEQVVRRLAMEGSAENQSYNRRLARPRRPSRVAA
jgi:hypothetical protein